jgi:hypothetical protein
MVSYLIDGGRNFPLRVLLSPAIISVAIAFSLMIDIDMSLIFFMHQLED